ncbi:MAG: hypothetical protein CMB57_00605 [Euryarchaeota archaeon]|nr:hypothetical protein [Euryarchaeota archaeon]
MNGRRRKDEPFNPFAPNAGQKARDRKEKVARQPSRPKPPTPQKPTNDLAAKQKAAMEALKQRREIETKTSAKPVQPQPVQKKHQPSPQPKPVPKTEIKKPDGREERLAALRAKSAATAQFAKEAKDAKKLDEKVESDIKPIAAPEPEVEVVIETKVQDTKKSSVSKGAANVFKTIKTEVKKSDRKQKRRRSNDKKGGGRQPQSKKLDRRKYLEYKYAARELLENDAISEEHRSNILGQIWAKGERSGVDEAVEFINQKEAELIIPEEVADEFRKMVKRYTTKR